VLLSVDSAVELWRQLSIASDGVVMWQAAKKEMELQRQMEWEQQRRTQLDVLKVKEMGVVERLDREVSTIKADLATLVRFIDLYLLL